MGSHPTVGVATYGPKVFDQVNSSNLNEELPVRMNILLVGRSVIEVHPTHLRSSIPHPKTDVSTNQIASR